MDTVPTPPAIAPISVGPVRIDCPVVLAPMTGVSDLPFRRMVRRFGSGLNVTEMIASPAAIRETRQSIQKAAWDAIEEPDMLHHYGSVTGVNMARKHLGWYTKGLPGSAEFRNRVNFIDDHMAVLASLAEFYTRLDPAGERHPRRLIASLPQAMFVLAPDLSIASANPAAEQLAGQGASRLVGRSVHDVLTFEEPLILERLIDREAHLVARGSLVRVFDHPARQIDVVTAPVLHFPGWQLLVLQEPVGVEALSLGMAGNDGTAGAALRAGHGARRTFGRAIMTRSILLVEDDATIATVITAALEAEGFVVARSETVAGRDLLLNAGPHALMLTDVMLADGDGIETLPAVRAHTIDAATIVPMLTSDAAPARDGAGMADGSGLSRDLSGALGRWLADHPPLPGRLYDDALAAFEAPLFRHVLGQTGGNQLRAAQILGINRNTLRKRLSELGINPELAAEKVAGAAGHRAD
eukprot:gene4372-4419_t